MIVVIHLFNKSFRLPSLYILKTEPKNLQLVLEL